MRRNATLIAIVGILFLLLPGLVFAAGQGEAAGQQEAAEQEAEEATPEEPVELLGYGLRYHFGTSEEWMPGYHYFPQNMPEVRIKERDVVVNEVIQQIIESTPAGEWPDFYFLKPNDLRRAVRLGIIEPLNDYLDANPEVRGQYSEGALDHFTIDGNVYALPYTVKPHAMYLNLDVFDTLGVEYPSNDWTWEEFIDIAEQLTDKPEYVGFVGNPGAWHILYSFIAAYDVQGYEMQDGRRVSNLADDPDAIEAIELFLELTSESGVTYTSEEEEEFGIGNAWNDGNAAMLFASTWAQRWGAFNPDTGEYRFNTAVRRVPQGPDGRGVFPDGYGIALHPSGNTDKAFEVIANVASREWTEFAGEVEEVDPVDDVWNYYAEDQARLQDGLPPWSDAESIQIADIAQSDYEGFVNATQDVYRFDFSLEYFNDSDNGLGATVARVAEGEVQLVDALREFDEWATENILNEE